MRAAVWYGRRNTKVEDVPDAPAPGPNEVKVKVGWVGICGTDLHEYAAGPIWMPIEPHPLTGKAAPIIQGHEFAGIITEVGSEVDGFKPGDRVTADSATWCGKCWACLRHEYSLCDICAYLGLGRDGAFAEYLTLPAAGVYHIPPELSLQKASFTEPTAVAVHVLRRGRLIPGESVMLIGAGNQGLLQFQLVNRSAASQVFVVELKGMRSDTARSLGATVFNPEDVDVVEEIKKRTDGNGVDLAIDDAGQAETLVMALQSTRTQGRVVEVGIFEEPVTFNINDLVLRERELIGILNNGGEMPQAIQYLADGRVDPTPLISNRISLEDVVEKGLEECVVNKATNVKVLVNCNPDLWDA
jgi:(R,R)-butanediol dehydrogenase / meso-butanediol dehydrogenase / diacetyl reductase